MDRVKRLGKYDESETSAIESRIQQTLEKIELWKHEAEAHEINKSKLIGLDSSSLLNTIELEAEEIMSELHMLYLKGNIRARFVISSFFRNLLVITKQPPRVLEYSEDYSAIVRLLLSERFLNIYLRNRSKLILRAFCVSDNIGNSGENLTKLSSISAISVGEFNPELTSSSQLSLISHIPINISPRMIRGKRKVNEEVRPKNTSESFRIYFSFYLGFNGGVDSFESITSSFPLKIGKWKKVKKNVQSIWTTPMEDIIWRNAMGNLESTAPIPNFIPFNQVNEAIRSKFNDFTGRNLTEKDMEVIQRKFFSPQLINQIKSDQSTLISFSQFMKPILVTENEFKTMSLTYWGWFHSLAIFISTHLHFEEKGSFQQVSFWKDGLILGYMSTTEAAEELKDSEQGTFLLRFSNSLPNAVTLDWKEPEGVYSYRGTSDELKHRNLVDRIMDIKRWKFFYPNIEKESLILKFTTNLEIPQISPGSEGTGKRGYVTASLKSHLFMDL